MILVSLEVRRNWTCSLSIAFLGTIMFGDHIFTPLHRLISSNINLWGHILNIGGVVLIDFEMKSRCDFPT
jgi:hypothetical protein